MSLMSYLVFWLADVVQPGFVSRYFSVHLFLLTGVVFGSVWAWVLEEYTSRPLLAVAFAILCGLLLAVFTWRLAGDLGVYRVPLVLVSAGVPTILYILIGR